MTPELLLFVEAYATGEPLLRAYDQAFPGPGPMPLGEKMLLARDVLAQEDAQEYLAFLHQEGRTVGAIPLRDHLFDLSRMQSQADALLERMMKRGGSSDSSAASVFGQKVRLEELRGKASGHYAQRTEFGVAQGGGSGKFSVEWAE